MFERIWSNNRFRWNLASSGSTLQPIPGDKYYPASVKSLGIAFIRDRRGVSAVEFAMVLPLMLTLYFGSVQLSQGIGIYRKVSLVASTVANIVTQYSSVANADMTNVLGAAGAIIAPYSAKLLGLTVSGVTIDKNGKATIAWSDTAGGSARPIGQGVALANGLAVPNTFLVWGEARYAYTPPIGAAAMGTITLHDQIFMSPRISTSIARVP